MEKLAINGGLPIRESKIPISRPDFGEEEIKAASEVIKSGLVEGNGPKTEEFENKFASYLGVNYAIAVNSATAALHLALLAANIGKGDEVILPALRFILQGFDTEHEICIFHGIARCHGELVFRIGDDLADEFTVQLGFGLIDVNTRGGILVGVDQIHRFLERTNKRLVRFRIFLAEFRCRPDGVESRRAAQNIVGTDNLAHLRVRQFLLLKRRGGEVRGNLGFFRKQGRDSVRMLHRHGPFIQHIVLAFAESFFRRHLQCARLDRDLGRRQGNAVLVGKILEGFYVGIVGVQVQRHCVDGGYTLDVQVSLGLVPDGQQRPDTA